MRNNLPLSMNCRNPNAVPAIDSTNVAVFNRDLIPIRAPNFPKNGEEINAARLEIPKTNPY